jgi:hypothetical protein
MAGDGTSYGSTYVSFTGDIPGALRRASEPAAAALAVEGEVILKRNCPVDSGELQESCYARVIKTPGRDLVVALGATADHAAPVEFGHLTRSGTFVPPNPFVRRSLSELTRGKR